ncbi:DUF732 domain-containing protein [Gloeocapsopsis dulcis]|uniref:DUF732 domain-containing protein n=1 Tax=Gloeocapsopsis dulcis AAB1 = 1H9 TaxID=1433147 RepID=A0A6N8FS82_9CHRO|nr:DUF732 domain-containing protein [Gloeocapsopsis dulcis]MUL34796.1 hypothetical protein [Gloeocapsopsis dulcis AAB1 = 1H9]WNN90136.1 DUF732 domain-containing protein [Gloeocapsopsis dulcis]
MKILHLGAILITAVSLVPGFSRATLAQDADYVCYITTKSGQVVDLSASICQLNGSSRLAKATSAAGSDQAFIADYERAVMGYPDAQDKLLTSIQRSPESNIMQAKSVCNELEAGLSLEEIKMYQTQGVTNKVDNINASVTATLATKHYCPQFSNL